MLGQEDEGERQRKEKSSVNNDGEDSPQLVRAIDKYLTAGLAYVSGTFAIFLSHSWGHPDPQIRPSRL